MIRQQRQPLLVESEYALSERDEVPVARELRVEAHEHLPVLGILETHRARVVVHVSAEREDRPAERHRELGAPFRGGRSHAEVPPMTLFASAKNGMTSIGCEWPAGIHGSVTITYARSTVLPPGLWKAE